MSRSSKRLSKQNKSKNDSQTPSQLYQTDSNINLKASIPRKILHTTSLSYLAAKGSPKEIHSLLFDQTALRKAENWISREILSKSIKSIVKTPIVHRWRNIQGFGIDYFMSAIKPQVWKRLNLFNCDQARKLSVTVIRMYNVPEPATNFQDEYLEVLESLIKSLRPFALDLRQFVFALTSGRITAKVLEKCITQICKHSGNLQSLNISLPSTLFSDQEKLKFALHNIIKKLAYSKKLKIELTCNFKAKKPQITNALTSHIGLAFPRYFERLQQLDFSFIVNKGDFDLFKRLDPKLTQNQIYAFVVQLGNLKGLQRLALCFKWHEAQDEELYWLGHKIGNNLINLNHLTLQFIRCNNLTGKGLKELGSGLSQSSANLKYIAINFRFCEGIYETDYKGFKLKLKKELPHLEDFLINNVKVKM